MLSRSLRAGLQPTAIEAARAPKGGANAARGREEKPHKNPTAATSIHVVCQGLQGKRKRHELHVGRADSACRGVRGAEVACVFR